MPLIKLSEGRWKYGKTGKVYSGKNAYVKARSQGVAIQISKRRAAGENIPVKGDSRKRGTIRRL